MKINNKKFTKKIRKNNKKMKKIKGGLFGFFNSGSQNKKENAENKSYTTTIKKGPLFFRTVYNVEYIIPDNVYIFKNPDSFFTPIFNVNLVENDSNTLQKCCIQIEEPGNTERIKFIEYFVKVNDEWYAMMRIYGLNEGLLAAVTNILFYKIDNKWFNLDKNSITFKLDTDVTKIDKDQLNILQKFARFDNSNSTILKIKTELLNKSYFEVTKTNNYNNMFDILNQFRDEQYINYKIKEKAAEEATKGFFDILFGT